MFHYTLKPLLTNYKSEHRTLTIFRFNQIQCASNSTNLADKQSLTVSYLTKSCGLSVQSANSASSLVDIKKTEKSDSVLELFRSHGFSQKDISNIISRCPRLLSLNPEKLRPKLEFFESLGIVGSDLAGTLISCNKLLNRRLNEGIKPTFDFIKCFINIDEHLSSSIRLLNRLCAQSLEKKVMPNVETLRYHNVPDSQIGKLLLQDPTSISLVPDMFKETVSIVAEMGIDPNSRRFISTVGAMTVLSKAKWDRKKEVLSSLGWSESDFDVAFSLKPDIVLTSEKKLRIIMDFMVNKVGLKASDLARCPLVFCSSLEKKLIPRWLVLQFLISQGLLDKSSIMAYMFSSSKAYFEFRFVNKYAIEVPEVINVYKMECSKEMLAKIPITPLVL